MTGYRIAVYWEKFGGTEEGSMNDERQIVVDRKPSGQEMRDVEDALHLKLMEMGLKKQGDTR